MEYQKSGKKYRKKSKQLNLRLTLIEHSVLQNHAEQLGMTVTDFLLTAADDYIKEKQSKKEKVDKNFLALMEINNKLEPVHTKA